MQGAEPSNTQEGDLHVWRVTILKVDFPLLSNALLPSGMDARVQPSFLGKFIKPFQQEAPRFLVQRGFWVGFHQEAPDDG